MKTRRSNPFEEEDVNVYSEEGSDLLLEDDEISTEEAAFMYGYLEAWVSPLKQKGGVNMVDFKVELENESHIEEIRKYLDDEAAIAAAEKKRCIVAFY